MTNYLMYKYFIMESNLNDEHLLKCATEEAWSLLSEELGWTESHLEKYQDNLDWQAISENKQIKWNLTMLDKFKERLHWDALSKTITSEQVSPEILDKFKDRWDWDKLSANWHLRLTYELIDKYAEYLNWRELLHGGAFAVHPYEEDPVGFYTRYKKYIPKYILKGSGLWDAIVDKQKERLTSEIIA